MDNNTKQADKVRENEDFAPTMDSLMEVLMESGIVTEKQAYGIAAMTLQLEGRGNG